MDSREPNESNQSNLSIHSILSMMKKTSIRNFLKERLMKTLNDQDKTVLRGLAEEIAAIAASPSHATTADNWRRLNDLNPVKPMVYIYQIPWREMNVDDELTLRTTAPEARGVEEKLRRTLYRWRHFPIDMIVSSTFNSPLVINNSGVGVRADMDLIPHDADGGISAQHYHSQLNDEKDLEKIKTPRLSLDGEATEERFEWTRDIFDGILNVEKRGKTAHNYAPWDRLVSWMNPEQVLMDLITRPDFVHAAMDRLTNAYLAELDQLEELNLLSLSDGDDIIGQGGLGHTGDLPLPDVDPNRVRLADQWGGAMAQIFSEVSPDMHEEFALQYEKKILDRFGLNYYGCCEPLHRKVDVVSRNLTKLRKISMSCWVDAEAGAKAIDGRFVFSFKPNPAFLATDGAWDRVHAKAELEKVLKVNRGRPVELILKDISTVRFEPRRLWEWADMAMELANHSQT